MMTDDLKGECNSVVSTLKFIKNLDYACCDELVEMSRDINPQEAGMRSKKNDKNTQFPNIIIIIDWTVFQPTPMCSHI